MMYMIASGKIMQDKTKDSHSDLTEITLLGEHQAQLINYLKVSGILVGLLVNFGNRKFEYKRLHPSG